MCLTGDKPKLHHLSTVPALKKGERFAPPAGADLIVAWRVWSLTGRTATQGVTSLFSKTQSARWPHGEPMKAHAAIKSDRQAVGVHAVKTREQLPQVGLGETSDKKLVVGEVVLWGDVAEHDNGYRAEYGYPLRLWTNDFLAMTELRDGYGVAVEAVSARDLLAMKGR